MRTILLPTDFSECSKNAIKYAIRFAEQTERKLLFFHSTFLDILTSTPTRVYLNAVKFDKESKLQMLGEFIENIYHSLHMTRNSNNTKFLVKSGPSVIESIKETIDEQFIDLIIIGTYGVTGFAKKMMGSTAVSLIEQAYCPVLAIPEKFKFNGVKKIAYASSDLDNLKMELNPIIQMAQKLEASLVIFHITEGNQFVTNFENFNSEVFMESLSHHFRFHSMSLHVIDIGNNSLTDAIDNFVKNNEPDILAMLTHKRSFFHKMFNPSQTKDLSYQLRVPLMALKGKINNQQVY